MTTCDSSPRVLLVGATGEVGRLAATDMIGRGAHLALAGRNEQRLAELAASSGCPSRRLDAYDLDACARTGPWALVKLGRLDGVLVTIGIAGFGPAAEVPDAAAEHLMTVNALCPMAVLRGAIPAVRDGGFLAAVSGAIVNAPLIGTADYAASKTALACWLGVLAREVRSRHIAVVDARLRHMDTGFASRAVVGNPPPLRPGNDPGPEVRALIDHLVGHLAKLAPPGPRPHQGR
ncbi:SDR family oxidoreductase [Streptomyces vinaceus]|uniref:SDR family oxidoreductase n=1 Tax=Streptomyces vinaceus TaxID=1960 RepID=A0A5J6JIC3_STRVI|nr:SDR family oxidoreductase [Streptomyces vinaceus]QEV49452.1 SDR family oxidoreductase [Streptomyces vinaceus]GHE45644.1 oxidoreductase [Streptomyces vinaceus]